MPRSDDIADAALHVLAAEGARGLTHRAVDRAAGVAEGSSSNCFRTREALLGAALARHLELELSGPAAPDARGFLNHILATPHLLAARYELFLESTRRPALAAELRAARERFTGFAEAALAAGGCRSPRAHALQLVAALDGALLDRLVFPGSGLDLDELVDRLLAGC